MVNNGFEGLDGWTQEGAVFNTGENGVLADTAQDRAALFQSAALSPDAYGLWLEFDILNALSPSAPFGVEADIFFGTLYLGNAAFGNSLEDGVFDHSINLFDLKSGGPSNAAPLFCVTTSNHGPGWLHYTFHLIIPPSSQVTLAFEFFELNGAFGDSTVAIDNVSLREADPPLAELAFDFLCGADAVRLLWPTEPNVRYQLETSTDLVNWIRQDEPSFLGSGRPLAYDLLPADRQFFRLIREPEPPPGMAPRNAAAVRSPATGHSSGRPVPAITTAPDGQLTARWPSVQGFSYQLEGRDGDLGEWRAASPSLSGTGGLSRCIVSPADAALTVFRLRITPESSLQ